MSIAFLGFCSHMLGEIHLVPLSNCQKYACRNRHCETHGLLEKQLLDCNPEIIAGLGGCDKEFVETAFRATHYNFLISMWQLKQLAVICDPKTLGRLCSGTGWVYLPDLLLALHDDFWNSFGHLQMLQLFYAFAAFWQYRTSVSVSRGALCSKLLFIAHVCRVAQSLRFLLLLIEPSHRPDRKLASPTAPAVIRSRLGPGSFCPFWLFQLPLSGYTHARVSKPVRIWLTPQCKQKMFDLPCEQGLMSGRIAVDVQQIGCRVPSHRFPGAKGVFVITSHKCFCLHCPGTFLLCPQLPVKYCKDAHTLLSSVF